MALKVSLNVIFNKLIFLLTPLLYINNIIIITLYSRKKDNRAAISLQLEQLSLSNFHSLLQNLFLLVFYYVNICHTYNNHGTIML